MENIIIYILLALIVILGIVLKIKKNGLRKYAIEMIVYAEKTLKDNKIKFDAVVNAVINKLPFPANLIPASLIEKLVQNTFDEIKVALDYQKEDK